MKIILISKYARTFSSGHPTRQVLFAKYFAKQGNEVILVSSNSNGVYTDLSGFDKDGFIYKNIEFGVQNWVIGGPRITLGMSLVRLWSMFLFELRLFLSLPSLAQTNPDVILVSSLALPTIVNGVILKKLTGAKLVFEIRDIWPLTLTEVGKFSPNNLIIKLLAWIEKFGYESADLLVGSMPNLREHVSSVTALHNKVVHVPMGYDPDFYEGSTEVLPESIQNQLPQSSFIVGYAGTIGKVNGIDQILEAARILEKTDRSVHFVFLGDGIEKKVYQSLYSDLDNVTWIPFVPKKSVQAFLINCQVLVHPILSRSLYRYGVSPNKWIDYMYSGRPIISPYDGYPSIINEAGCGVFIEPENPEIFAKTILEFASKPAEELDKMGARGREYLEKNLSYEVLASNYINHIERISA